MANPGVTTVDLIVAEAKRRGIEVRDFEDVVTPIKQFSYNGHQELVYYSVSSMLSHVAFKAFLHKGLTSALLRQGGFPIPLDGVAEGIEEARRFLAEYKKMVIKPLQHTGGKGVTPNISTDEQLVAAFNGACDVNAQRPSQLPAVVCQQHVEGKDFRLLVINKKVVYGIERIPASVIGDGVKTVRELVDERNAGIGEDYHIQIEEQAEALLEEQGMATDSVVPDGQMVQLARIANAHAGGTLRDVTDLVCEEAKQTAIKVAEYFDVPVVGVDVLSSDISTDPGVIIELNSTPDFTIHHYPDEGEAQNPTADFLDMIFPETVQSA